MTAKGIMHVHSGSPYYTTIANFDTADVHLPKLQKVGGVTIAPKEIVQIKEKRCRYPLGTKAIGSDSDIKNVHYKPL